MFGGNPAAFWPKDSFFTDMTAIALVATKAGIVVAADGLSRWGDDSTRDDLTRQRESDHEKKVFKAEFGTLDIAWAVTGSVFNKDRSFSLIAEARVPRNRSRHQYGTIPRRTILCVGSPSISSCSAENTLRHRPCLPKIQHW
jgi:hypothetical protein